MSAIDLASEHAQYLSFRIGDAQFAVGILRVREIIRYDALTRVPTAPEWVRGVINLRGSVVPVLDLAVRMGQPAAAPTKWTCIIILEVQREQEVAVLGLVVDEVRQVLDLAPGDIAPAPSFGTNVRSELLHGMGKVDRHFVLLLDVDRALGAIDVPLGELRGEEQPRTEAMSATGEQSAEAPQADGGGET